MKVWVFTVSYQEGYMMPFFLRHYSTFADRIIVWDEASTDGTREMVKRCPKAELRDWPYKGSDDERFIEAANNWYREARGKADWVIWPDVDELLWHPSPRPFLERAKSRGMDIVHSRGYALTPRCPPKDDGRSQFYELSREGVPMANYNKSLIFNPEKDINFAYGRHEVNSFSGKMTPLSLWAFRLFHCHWLGIEHTKRRNKRNYDLAPEHCKKYAWNYRPDIQNKASQPGTVGWLEDIYKNRKTVDVFSHAPS